MNFRKTSKGEGHFQSKNSCCRFWTFKQDFLSMKFKEEEKLQHVFFWKRGGGHSLWLKGHLELFWNIIRLIVAIRSLDDPVCQLAKKIRLDSFHKSDLVQKLGNCSLQKKITIINCKTVTRMKTFRQKAEYSNYKTGISYQITVLRCAMFRPPKCLWSPNCDSHGTRYLI